MLVSGCSVPYCWYLSRSNQMSVGGTTQRILVYLVVCSVYVISRLFSGFDAS
jgi:hypothetical protein